MELAEIQAALAAKPELVKGLIPVIATTDEGKTFITTANETYFREKIGDEVKTLHGHYDKVVEETIGVKRPDGVKSSEFVKQQLLELKDLKEKGGKSPKIEELEAENKKLKEQAGNSEHWHKEYHKALPEWQDKVKNLETKVSEYEGAQKKGSIMGELNRGLAALKFNENIPESARKAMINQTLENIAKNAKIENEKPVFLKEDGTLWKGPDGFTPATADQILAEQMKDLLHTDSKGGNSQREIPGEIIKVKQGDVDTEKLVLDKTKFSTREAFTAVAEKTLLDKGVTRTDKRFNELLNKAYGEYEVAKLPLK